MDIRNFFSGNIKKTQKREIGSTNCESNKKTCDNDYEKIRKRVVLEAWKNEFPWIGYNADGTEMWCKVCRAFPKIADVSSTYFKSPGVCGDAIRIASVRAHHKTKKHTLCIQAKLALDDPKGTPLNRCLINLTEEQKKKMTILFNTAYFCAKEELAFTKFEKLCKLQIKNGVVCGQNYLNDKGARMFVHNIAAVQKVQLVQELEKARFFSVLADGSTDCSLIEEDIVYVRFVSSGIPVTKFVNLIELENADAPGVLKALIQTLDEVQLNEDKRHEKLVCVNLDGASVNMGRNTGVAALLKKEIPHIVAIHCIAHNLELAIMDALKNTYIKGVFDSTVRGIVKFYSRSPKQRRALVAISSYLEVATAQMGSISQIRWLSSQERALRALAKNLTVIEMHFGSIVKEKSNAKLLGYLKEMRSVKFIRTLHYWIDIIEILSNVSQKFQSDRFTLLDVSLTVEDTCMKLEELKHSVGRNLKFFTENLKNGSFQGIKLNARDTSDGSMEDIINDVMDCIISRFSMISEKPLSLFQVFNFNLWPMDSMQELSTYGNKDISEICDHFSAVLSPEEIMLAQKEWSTFKVHVKRMSNSASSSPFSVMSYLLKTQPEDLTKILLLVELLFCFSQSTSACERGFSCMNRIKTSFRSRLQTESKSDLMRISIDGPENIDFDPTLAIEDWQLSGKGTRHIDGHALHSDFDLAF